MATAYTCLEMDAGDPVAGRKRHAGSSLPDAVPGDGGEQTMHSVTADMGGGSRYPRPAAAAPSAKFPDSQLGGMCVGGSFVLGHRIGFGSFGEVFAASRVGEQTARYAVKVEPISARNPKLKHEARILKKLAPSGVSPRVYMYSSGERHSFMVIDKMGANLEDLLQLSGGVLSHATVAMLAVQMLHIVEVIHSYGLIHRDIKPENFLMGTGENAQRVYAIDFGLAKRFHQLGEHIPWKTDKRGLTGTARYASIPSHCGIEQSRRDDLESLAYVLLYLVVGKLPWQGFRMQDKEQKFAKILEMKRSDSVRALCRAVPAEFSSFVEYVRSLGFDHSPDYRYCRSLFTSFMNRMRLKFDFVFDWNVRAREWLVRLVDVDSGRRDPRTVSSLQTRSGWSQRLSTQGYPLQELVLQLANYPQNPVVPAAALISDTGCRCAAWGLRDGSRADHATPCLLARRASASRQRCCCCPVFQDRSSAIVSPTVEIGLPLVYGELSDACMGFPREHPRKRCSRVADRDALDDSCRFRAEASATNHAAGPAEDRTGMCIPGGLDVQETAPSAYATLTVMGPIGPMIVSLRSPVVEKVGLHRRRDEDVAGEGEWILGDSAALHWPAMLPGRLHESQMSSLGRGGAFPHANLATSSSLHSLSGLTVDIKPGGAIGKDLHSAVPTYANLEIASCSCVLGHLPMGSGPVPSSFVPCRSTPLVCVPALVALPSATGFVPPVECAGGSEAGSRDIVADRSARGPGWTLALQEIGLGGSREESAVALARTRALLPSMCHASAYVALPASSTADAAGSRLPVSVVQEAFLNVVGSPPRMSVVAPAAIPHVAYPLVQPSSGAGNLTDLAAGCSSLLRNASPSPEPQSRQR